MGCGPAVIDEVVEQRGPSRQQHALQIELPDRRGARRLADSLHAARLFDRGLDTVGEHPRRKVSWPLFTGYNMSYGVRQAQAALQQQEAILEQLGLSVTLDVWNGYYSLDSANQQLTVTAVLAKTADENLQVALGRYQAGVGTMVDVLTAQAELAWKVACASLALALGRLSSAEPLRDGAALP